MQLNIVIKTIHFLTFISIYFAVNIRSEQNSDSYTNGFDIQKAALREL